MLPHKWHQFKLQKDTKATTTSPPRPSRRTAKGVILPDSARPHRSDFASSHLDPSARLAAIHAQPRHKGRPQLLMSPLGGASFRESILQRTYRLSRVVQGPDFVAVDHTVHSPLASGLVSGTDPECWSPGRPFIVKRIYRPFCQEPDCSCCAAVGLGNSCEPRPGNARRKT